MFLYLKDIALLEIKYPVANVKGNAEHRTQTRTPSDRNCPIGKCNAVIGDGRIERYCSDENKLEIGKEMRVKVKTRAHLYPYC